jgi:hypothetical protein
VAKADKDSGMNPPATEKPKKATKPKKAAANSNEETKADAA